MTSYLISMIFPRGESNSISANTKTFCWEDYETSYWWDENLPITRPWCFCSSSNFSYEWTHLTAKSVLAQQLHELGCRKIAVAGIPPVGCLPIQMTAKFKNPEDRKCVEEENLDARIYNHKLANLLPQLQSVLPKSKIAYADVYEPMIDMINHPQKYGTPNKTITGFLETKKGCCGTGFVEAGPLCNELTPTCRNSSQYLFWDSIHPCESAYYYISLFLEEQVLPQLFFCDSTHEYWRSIDLYAIVKKGKGRRCYTWLANMKGEKEPFKIQLYEGISLIHGYSK